MRCSLEVVTINGKPWTRAKEVCKTFEYSENAKPKDVLKKHVSIENKLHKNVLQSRVTAARPMSYYYYYYFYSYTRKRFY